MGSKELVQPTGYTTASHLVPLKPSPLLWRSRFLGRHIVSHASEAQKHDQTDEVDAEIGGFVVDLRQCVLQVWGRAGSYRWQSCTWSINKPSPIDYHRRQNIVGSAAAARWDQHWRLCSPSAVRAATRTFILSFTASILFCVLSVLESRSVNILSCSTSSCGYNTWMRKGSIVPAFSCGARRQTHSHCLLERLWHRWPWTMHHIKQWKAIGTTHIIHFLSQVLQVVQALRNFVENLVLLAATQATRGSNDLWVKPTGERERRT